MLNTRILSNYDLLTVNEVDSIYEHTMEMVDSDEVSRGTYEISLRPTIFHAAKHGDTHTMLPLLKQAVDADYNTRIRPRLLKLLTQTAQAEGDYETLRDAAVEYSRSLESTIDRRNIENWRELQILYDIYKIKEEYQKRELAMRNHMLLITAIATLVLISLAIALVILWRRSHRSRLEAVKAHDELLREHAELKETTEQLTQARDEAKLAERIKDAFIRNMNEEVKQPVNAMLEYTHLIVDCSDALDRPYLKQYADIVSLNAETLSNIIQNMLTLAQVDNNSITTHPSREQLSRICSAAIKSIQPLTNGGAKITLDPKAPDIMVQVDKNLLTQVLWQVLSNAVKHGQNSDVLVSYTTDPASNTLNISVADSGPGINPKYADDIFNRFTRIDKSVPGTGLGLNLARSLTEVMGGTLRLDTSYTRGARFIITLPL